MTELIDQAEAAQAERNAVGELVCDITTGFNIICFLLSVVYFRHRREEELLALPQRSFVKMTQLLES